MSDQPLTDAFDTTFRTLDEMIKQHHYAEAYARSQQRLAFVHARLDKLLAELRAVREAVTVLRTMGAAQTAEVTWRKTRQALRLQAPAELRSPASALEDESLALLLLVEYIAAATQLVHGLRVDLMGRLTSRLDAQPAVCCDREAGGPYGFEPLIAALHDVADVEGVALLEKIRGSDAAH